MKYRVSIILLSIALLGLISCEKGPGEGGTSTITGSVITHEYNGNFTVLRDIYPAAKEDVYIIYGDNADEIYGDQMETDWNGQYEFNYLQKGTYIIYVYSKDSTLDYSITSQKKAIMQEVEITGKNQTVVAPDITIIK
jgi:hypothetical protein